MALEADQWVEKASFPVRVGAVRREAEDILSFELLDPDGGALPPFTAGAHIEVTIREGLTRQYSLCNDPAENHRYVIAVLKDLPGFIAAQTFHELRRPSGVNGFAKVAQPLGVVRLKHFTKFG